MSMRNEYLEQVQAKQQILEEDLKVRAPAPAAGGLAAPQAPGEPDGPARLQRARTSTAIRVQQAVDIRITGFWRWKTVIVPPNAYVVHTRRGRDEPLHLGLGISFGFDPYRDAFLVVPSAMQTILINAHCICRELQGILVQGYLQWIIADFATAYKKLDFTDAVDPMRVVNIQLREQAEAAIKDKVSTMSVDDVLSDKQPIIEELTARLRQVAEGEGGSDSGLGLRIVTVQIKEAVVSSARLWENLQKPFRVERDQVARLAELTANAMIEDRERDQQKRRESANLEVEGEVNRLRTAQQAEAFDLDQREKARRHAREQEVARQAAAERAESARQDSQAKRELEEQAVGNAHALALARQTAKHQEKLQEHELRIAGLAREQEAAQAQAALEAAQVQADLARKALRIQAELKEIEERNEAANRQEAAQVAFERDRQSIQNGLSPVFVQAELVRSLPSIAEKLPKPDELRSIAIGDSGGREAQALSALVAQILGIVDLVRGRPDPAPPAALAAPEEGG